MIPRRFKIQSLLPCISKFSATHARSWGGPFMWFQTHNRNPFFTTFKKCACHYNCTEQSSRDTGLLSAPNRKKGKDMEIAKYYERSWRSIMDETINPLRNSQLTTAYMMMQVLAWMWSAIFSIAMGSYFVFGVSVVGHVVLIAGIFLTVMTFRNAERSRGPIR